jgi:glutamyl-tRNA synthetase
MACKTRIAPTPSGYLHIGNAFNFLLVETIAQKTGAKVLLRIDDLDAARKRTEYVEDIFETINWLQINIHEGPAGIEDFEKNWSQHTRSELYDEALKKLREKELLFACDCSRSTLKGFNVYPNVCLNKPLSLDKAQLAWRIKIEGNEIIYFEDKIAGSCQIDLREHPGSFIVKTKSGTASYQLASLIDDLHFGITHLVRGNDLTESTAQQLFLSNHLGLKSFSSVLFFHHALLKDPVGKKLSKSTSSTSLKYLRQNGISPSDIRHSFSEWLSSFQISW